MQLIALVLHIADGLHAQELDEQQRRIGDQHASDRQTPACTSADEQGNHHDPNDAHAGHGYVTASDSGDVSTRLDQGTGHQGRS
ncbi:hypothetical protein [Pseudarthrobacter oxydans]|uniref:hypothetical protein n=1 Tax=Pseudarthrobacter oxydans TaxID=1671 RepID=UPI0037F1B083